MKKIPKRKTVSRLKKDCWKLFSELIRRRDADWKGDVACCTCRIKKNWRFMHAGHFLGGRRNSTIFDPRNCHAQCPADNVYKHGDQLNYYRFMVKKYGEKTVKELEELNKQNIQFTANQLEIF